MNYFYLYDEASGRLLSGGTELADPLPEGVGIVECEWPLDERTWDPERRVFRSYYPLGSPEADAAAGG